MQFVQKTVFSSDGISQDLVNLMGSFGITRIKQTLEKSKRPDQLKSLIEKTIDKIFDIPEIDLIVLQKNVVPYQSMERALASIERFDVESNYFLSTEVRHRKYRILLESVTFVEAEALHKLLSKEYDVDSVKKVLFTKPKKAEVESE